jgi:hypothetical protein
VRQQQPGPGERPRGQVGRQRRAELRLRATVGGEHQAGVPGRDRQLRCRLAHVAQQLLDQVTGLGQTSGPAGGFGQVADGGVPQAEVVRRITGLRDPAQVLERALVLAKRQRGTTQVPLPAGHRVVVQTQFWMFLRPADVRRGGRVVASEPFDQCLLDAGQRRPGRLPGIGGRPPGLRRRCGRLVQVAAPQRRLRVDQGQLRDQRQPALPAGHPAADGGVPPGLRIITDEERGPGHLGAGPHIGLPNPNPNPSQGRQHIVAPRHRGHAGSHRGQQDVIVGQPEPQRGVQQLTTLTRAGRGTPALGRRLPEQERRGTEFT